MTPEQDAIRRATLAAQREMNALDAATLEELQQLYQQAADDIAARIEQYAGADGNVSLQEMQNVLAQVNARLKALSEARNALLNSSTAQAADLGVSPLTAAGTGAAVGVAGILSSSEAAQTSNAALQVVRTLVAADGLQLSDRIWRIDRQARDAVVNAIERAVIQGQGAAQAAREFLAQGSPVPGDVLDKMNAANAGELGKETHWTMTGDGSPMNNAMRLFRTEINRAHGEAYINGFLSLPGAAGVRFTLSPMHPKPDICDVHAAADLYGLGPGVYPTRETCPWPAHPNTMSYVVGVFKDEVRK
jgi:hypothetical protein